jgi:hypothetical protein
MSPSNLFDVQRAVGAQRCANSKDGLVRCVAASPDGLAAGRPLAVSYAIVIVVVMIAAACSHEDRIVAVIVIEDRHALGQAFVIVRCR